MDFLQLIIIATGLVGQGLVAKRNRWGFVFWIAGNLALSVVFWRSSQFALIALHALYSAIQIYSFISWSRSDKSTTQPVAASCKCDLTR